MSTISTVSKLQGIIVEQDGQIVFEMPPNLGPCANILDIKNAIEKKHGYNVG